MKIKIILYIFISIFFMASGCNKDKIDTCGTENPQEVEWLKAKLDKMFCAEVYSIYFNGMQYISLCDCPDMADAMIVIYDCQGTKVCEWGGIMGGTCNMPTSFTYDYYEKHKKFIYKQIE
jgi:hypothetical protein